MLLTDLASRHNNSLQTAAETHAELIKACSDNEKIAEHAIIGKSRTGRDLDAFVIGTGPITVSLISGSHADEPVGSETIRLLISEFLSNPDTFEELFKRCKFLLIPQINPDAEELNKGWMKEWPSVESYITNTFREKPGDDIEFGYPALRPENESASSFWKEHGPVDVHISLHGMGYAEGVMLLIERHWTSRTQQIRDRYTARAAELGLGLHTHNRKGEKGFFYIEDGYTTTPEGAAMQAHFKGVGDYETAALFHQSSMEYIRTLSEDPLCLVTEIPLFAMEHSGSDSLIPENYVEFKATLPEVRMKLDRGESVGDILDRYKIRPVALNHAIELQLLAIELAIETKETQDRLKAQASG